MPYKNPLLNKLLDKWNKAVETGEPVPIGDVVVCDLCNADYTNRNDPGGFIFESKGCCPECGPEFIARIERYGEQQYIRAVCPDGLSFADFIRAYRRRDAAIHIFNA